MNFVSKFCILGSLQHVKLNSYKIKTALKQHWKSVFEVPEMLQCKLLAPTRLIKHQ